jgi:kynureninase
VFAAQRHLARAARRSVCAAADGLARASRAVRLRSGLRTSGGIDRFTVGTPSILALAALDCGVDTVLAAGIEALRAKSDGAHGSVHPSS